MAFNKDPVYKKTCKYPNCTSLVGKKGAQGYCPLHYKRWNAHDGEVDFPRPNYKLSPQQRDEIAQRFFNGENSSVLSKEYGVNVPNIHRIYKRRGFPLKMGGRHIVSINQQAFEIITPESSYWIGFLMADGCVWKNTVSLALANRDVDHLNKFRKFLKSDHKIRQNKAKTAYHMSFGSKKIAADLISYGVVPRKSLVAKVIGLENNRDFWRGVIDGDGTVGMFKSRKTKKPCLSLCGSKDLVTQFHDFAKKICPESQSTVRYMKNSHIYEIRFWDKHGKKIVEFLYKDSDDYLDRKHKTAMEIISSP